MKFAQVIACYIRMYYVGAEKALSFLPGSLGSILGSQSHLQDIPWLCKQQGESPSNKAIDTGESGL